MRMRFVLLTLTGWLIADYAQRPATGAQRMARGAHVAAAVVFRLSFLVIRFSSVVLTPATDEPSNSKTRTLVRYLVWPWKTIVAATTNERSNSINVPPQLSRPMLVLC